MRDLLNNTQNHVMSTKSPLDGEGHMEILSTKNYTAGPGEDELFTGKRNQRQMKAIPIFPYKRLLKEKEEIINGDTCYSKGS